jgi:DNA ligase-1
MLFKQFASVLSEMESVSSRLVITEKLALLFRELSQEEIAVVPYLLQGRVAPAYSGIEFGMAEKSVVKAVSFALQIDHKDFVREVLRVGDVGQAVEKARSEFTSFEQEDLPLLHVFAELKRITEATGNGSQETKAKILALLFTKLDPQSCRYLSRIPVGQLRLGASDVTILDALSWMLTGDKSLRVQIEKAYQVRPDLGYICAHIQSKGIDGVRDIKPTVFTPILMMKAERLSSGAEIIEKIGPCIIEPKYDGLRLQIHIEKFACPDNIGEILQPKADPPKAENSPAKRDRDKLEKNREINIKYSVKIYTRGLEVVTHMYPDIVQSIQSDIHCDDCILEGEALGWDSENERFLPFQETIQRKRKHDIADAAVRVPIRVMVFDLLYLNRASSLSDPLTKRKQKLSSIISSKSSTLKLSPMTEVSDPKEIEKYFDTYIAEGLEGIMAKKPDSIYKPGAREFSWVKLKRSYSSRVNDTIDCVVMGYDAGKGKRAAFGIGAVLVGVYDQKEEKFVTIAKIGTGMTDEEWRTLKANSEKRIAKSKPEEYVVAKEMECDVWVEPRIVLEIRSDEITQSKLHTSGWSLRFPRLERFREKKPEDATTREEIDSLIVHRAGVLER